jgi:phosphohistidine phosphatase
VTPRSTTARRLVVMRHAEAERWAQSDAERGLTESGRASARAAGQWLAQNDLIPDHALVSAARRTRETFEHLALGAESDLEPDLRLDLYQASPESALDELRLAPDASHTLLLVGHNPTISFLANLLQDGLGEPAAITAMTAGYPTAALTVMEYERAWADLSFGDARVSHFHVGRG